MNTGSPAAEQTRTLNCIAAAACLASSCLAAVLLQVPCVRRSCMPAVAELVVVVSMVSFAALQFLADGWYGSKVLRHDPASAQSGLHAADFSDTQPVLVLSMVVVASHLALPIRWVCLLPLEVLVGPVYLFFALAVGARNDSHVWSAFVLFEGITACAIIGRRTIEDFQRESFCQIVREREMKASTELRLSQIEDEFGSEDERSVAMSAGNESRPETSPSSRVFEEAPRHALAKLIEVGRKQNWYIHNDEIQLTPDVLGQGSYGLVMAAKYHGSPVAVKISKVLDTHHSRSARESAFFSMLNEVRVLRWVRHPNVVLLHGAWLDASIVSISLVMERVSGRTLEEIIARDGPHQPLQLSDRLCINVDISRALRYLHSRHRPIVHGDLKASNIIAEPRTRHPEGSYRAKLLDFGLSRVLTRHAMPLGGTPLWMAPEVMLYPDQPPQVGADVFSFGRLAFLVMTGLQPLKVKNKQELLDMVEARSVPPLPWPGTDADAEKCRAQVDACVEFEAGDRPPMDVVGQHFEEALCGDDGSAGLDSESSLASTESPQPPGWPSPLPLPPQPPPQAEAVGRHSAPSKRSELRCLSVEEARGTPRKGRRSWPRQARAPRRYSTGRRSEPLFESIKEQESLEAPAHGSQQSQSKAPAGGKSAPYGARTAERQEVRKLPTFFSDSSSCCNSAAAPARDSEGRAPRAGGCPAAGQDYPQVHVPPLDIDQMDDAFAVVP